MSKKLDFLISSKDFFLTTVKLGPFMLIQEVSSTDNDLSTIPVSGDIQILSDSVATMSNNSLTWYSNGIEYYLLSNALSKEELIEVANSVNTVPLGK